LRRADPAGAIESLSDLTLDLKNMCVVRENKPAICLSPEQFRFFSALFEKSPKFVSKDEICRQVFMTDPPTSVRKALNMVSYRLRIKLGAQLSRRIKNSKACGWVYLNPRDRRKEASAADKTASCS